MGFCTALGNLLSGTTKSTTDGGYDGETKDLDDD
jgi:hypothetical protein